MGGNDDTISSQDGDEVTVGVHVGGGVSRNIQKPSTHNGVIADGFVAHPTGDRGVDANSSVASPARNRCLTAAGGIARPTGDGSPLLGSLVVLTAAHCGIRAADPVGLPTACGSVRTTGGC